MKIWTYATATPAKPYWVVEQQGACFIEYPDGRLEWRWLVGGTEMSHYNIHNSFLSGTFKGKPLDRCYWPQWYVDINEGDYLYLDEGL